MATTPTKIGRYDILELVGRGGMGALYRGHDAMLERDVAVKVMLVDFTVDPAARTRFEREARAVARLQHRNVVTIHELGEAEGAPYIVMEFLSGQDLEVLLKAEPPLTLAQKLDIVIQLCEGLGYAHEQGIVHRDVKPGNVRVLEDGTVKILDFGIAKFAVSSVTQSGSIMGTPSYMSPEQIMGQPVDGRADLFSAGVLLYEMLAGKKPFSGDAPTAVVYQIMHVDPAPLTEVVADLPEALLAVVSRALQKNPNDRYSRASEMASDLQMVKMMLDLPLKGGTEGTNPAMNEMTLRLYASSKEKTGANQAAVLVDQKMRKSAEEQRADAAIDARREAPSSKGMIYGVAAAVVLLIGGGAYFMSLREPTPSAGAPNNGATSRAAGAGAPSSAPAVSEGPLSVSSAPAGAKISVNGVDTTKTATTGGVALTVKVGDEITATLAGFGPQSTKVTETDLKAGTLGFKFSPKPQDVRLTISGPYPFEVVQGNKVLSAASQSHEFKVPASDKPITVVARSPEVLLNMPVTVDFRQASVSREVPPLGFLQVFAADETCTVLVDNQDIGNPPIPRKAIVSGPHTVNLKCGAGKVPAQKVTVPEGQSYQVKFGPPGT